jgi:tetratricopeptide (TPR) repeat protein
MDIYLSTEEKYIKAVDKLWYGNNRKALRLLNEIVADDPFYAKAHYQLGKLYYYEIKDYQAAGYHFRTCTELAPDFPDVYYHYLHLVVFLNMGNAVQSVKEKALTVPGVDTASVYNLAALYAEKQKDWNTALEAYRQAALDTTVKTEKDSIEESIARVKAKKKQGKKKNSEIN